jgi:glutamate synthase domain-containing protein 3
VVEFTKASGPLTRHLNEIQQHKMGQLKQHMTEHLEEFGPVIKARMLADRESYELNYPAATAHDRAFGRESYELNYPAATAIL